MVERGIIFKPDLVPLIMRGAKTETRRLIGAGHGPPNGSHSPKPWRKPMQWCWATEDGGGWTASHRYGEPGDGLWVRETWGRSPLGAIYFMADHPLAPPKQIWKPAIHLKQVDARVRMVVVKVWPEELLDIDEAGAKREGFASLADFFVRWDQINAGHLTHTYNPWVWATRFELRR